MGAATHEQVNLLLRLFEERREAKLRDARDWFAANYHVKTLEEATRICPAGSKENTYIRMVIGYWEMVASIVNRGLIEEDLFFENGGEMWAVFEQMKPTLGEWRKVFSSPNMFSNLEQVSKRYEDWREKKNPGSNEAIRKFMAQMAETAQAAKAKAAGN